MDFLQKVAAFVFSVVSTGDGKFEYKVPQIQHSETVNIFGKNITVTESYADGKLSVEAKLA